MIIVVEVGTPTPVFPTLPIVADSAPLDNGAVGKGHLNDRLIQDCIHVDSDFHAGEVNGGVIAVWEGHHFFILYKAE